MKCWCNVMIVMLVGAGITRGQDTTASYYINGPESMTSASITAGDWTGYSVIQVNVTGVSDTTVSTQACIVGTWASAEASACTACVAGKYSGTALAVSVAACIACDPGWWSSAVGATNISTCKPCSINTYSGVSGANSVGTCQSCPQFSSSYAASNSISACVCNPGYSGANGGNCTVCNASQWCLNGQANPCPSNSISFTGASSLSQCLCKAGYYGDTTMTGYPTLCQFCKENHYCPGGGVNLTYACQGGMYSAAGSDDVGDCSCPRFATSQQRSSQLYECVCQSGYYKVYNASVVAGGWQCDRCQPGQFCYNNTNKTCPANSISLGDASSVQNCYCLPGYANATVQTELVMCVDCPANFYCAGKGAKIRCVTNAVSPSQSKDSSRCYCDWGWKGVNNSVCEQCQSPTYCYGGLEAQCSSGTSSSVGSWDRLNCSCIPGRWGPQGGPCLQCIAGKYNLLPGCSACNATVDTDCIKCPVGTWSNVSGRSTLCDPCNAGTFSSPEGVSGATVCVNCALGKYSLQGSGNCTKCLLGWWAPAGSTACSPCPLNTYLNVEGKGSEADCIACPDGTITTFVGNSDPKCTACPPGTFQQNGVCSECAGGSYSIIGSTMCTVCLSGTYAQLQASTCTACASGTFNAQNGSSRCWECAAGYYTDFVGYTVCKACSAGSISSVNGSAACSSCSAGKFSVEASSACSLCPAGSWSARAVGSNAECTDCGKGKYSVLLGATRVDVCYACWGGTFAGNNRSTQVCKWL